MKTIHCFVVNCMLLALSSCVVSSEPPDLQVMRESRPVGDAKELNIDLKYDVGNLEITKIAGDNLFSFDLQYDRRRYDPQFTFNGAERASMRLEMNTRSGFAPGRGSDNDLTFRLSDKVPLDLNVASGVSESHLDLTGLQVRKMQLRGGVGKTEVTFDKPSGQAMETLDVESGVGELRIHGLGNAQLARLDLKGGVGHTELDFSGELGTSRTDATVKVGVGEIKLMIPREADVEIEAEGSFLSNISAPSFTREGRVYTHRGDAGARIHIRVESGIGSVQVDLI